MLGFMMSNVIITMTPNIISIEPPGGCGGGGALPFAMVDGLCMEGMKVGLVEVALVEHFILN
jgi:hypothetical protein